MIESYEIGQFFRIKLEVFIVTDETHLKVVCEKFLNFHFSHALVSLNFNLDKQLQFIIILKAFKLSGASHTIHMYCVDKFWTNEKLLI